MIQVIHPPSLEHPFPAPGDWTHSEEEFPIPGVCRTCRRGRMPAQLAPWCGRWIVYGDMVGAGSQLALMRLHRGGAGIWYVVEDFHANGAVQRARLMVMGIFDRAQWGGPQPSIHKTVSSLTINKTSHLLFELKPGAIRALLGVSGLAIANQRPLLSDLWGQDGVALEENLALALDYRARLKHIAEALLSRPGPAPAPAHDRGQ